MIHLAVLGSGRGSNFEAIQKAIIAGELEAKVSVVISDKQDAPILEKAQSYGIPAIAVPRDNFDTRQAHEKEIVALLQNYTIDYIVLAGYMRILTSYFIRQFPNRILNIHPSLLPAFKGLHAQKQALEYGVKVSGATVHLVNEEVDGGRILGQKCVPVYDSDTEESLSQRILAVEHQLFPEVLQKISEGSLKIPMEVKA